jgi:hypothetical protein
MDDRSQTPMSTAPSEVSLLLRADAEQLWLHREVIPEEPAQLDEQDALAALAYLEAMWNEATIRARATDAAHVQLHGCTTEHEGVLHGAAGRYHTAVRVLREILAGRVAAVVQPDGAETVLDAHAAHSSSCTAGRRAPRAA